MKLNGEFIFMLFLVTIKLEFANADLVRAGSSLCLFCRLALVLSYTSYINLLSGIVSIYYIEYHLKHLHHFFLLNTLRLENLHCFYHNHSN